MTLPAYVMTLPAYVMTLLAYVMTLPAYVMRISQSPGSWDFNSREKVLMPEKLKRIFNT